MTLSWSLGVLKVTVLTVSGDSARLYLSCHGCGADFSSDGIIKTEITHSITSQPQWEIGTFMLQNRYMSNAILPVELSCRLYTSVNWLSL
jgi:hypothetical protein